VQKRLFNTMANRSTKRAFHMTTLIIARHGNTFHTNDIVRRVGRTDLPLVEHGLMQGRLLGAALQHHNLLPDVVYTSTMQRTIQTAAQALNTMNVIRPIQQSSIFNEIDYGPDEMQTEQEVIDRIGMDALHAWEAYATVPNGWRVSPTDIIKNWQIFSETLDKEFKNQTILVVTSNGIARFAPYLTGDFAGFCGKHRIKMSTGAFSVFKKTPDNANWQCLQWNIVPKRP